MTKQLARRAVLAGIAVASVSPVLPAVARQPESAELALWRGLALEDGDGRPFQIGGGSASLTLVKMWANWCPPCVAELPSLAAMAETLGRRVEVILLSHPQWWAQDLASARRHRVTLRLAVPSQSNDAAAVQAALLVGGTYRVPRSLAFRASSPSVAWTHIGGQDWSAPATLAQLRTLAG